MLKRFPDLEPDFIVKLYERVATLFELAKSPLVVLLALMKRVNTLPDELIPTLAAEASDELSLDQVHQVLIAKRGCAGSRLVWKTRGSQDFVSVQC